MNSWLCECQTRPRRQRSFCPFLRSTPSPIGWCAHPALAALWTPRHPQLGRYEVCTTLQPLADVTDPSWTIESAPPLDAFGAAGTFNRAAVAQLYGGRRPTVARGWRTENGRFLSITLVSPYPNRELTALEPGTLIIRYFVTG